jgi:hypothetical protein
MDPHVGVQKSPLMIAHQGAPTLHASPDGVNTGGDPFLAS